MGGVHTLLATEIYSLVWCCEGCRASILQQEFALRPILEVAGSESSSLREIYFLSKIGKYKTKILKRWGQKGSRRGAWVMYYFLDMMRCSLETAIQGYL